MKRITIVFLLATIFACAVKEEEIMFTDYMNDILIESINLTVNDVDFKIVEQVKIKDILAKDSIPIFSKNLKKLESLFISDSLSVEKNIKLKNKEIAKKRRYKSEKLLELTDEIIANYQELIDIRRGVFDRTKKRTNDLSSKINELNNNPDKVLSTKYQIVYTMKLPDEKLKKTFKKFAFTNSEQNKFLSSE